MTTPTSPARAGRTAARRSDRAGGVGPAGPADGAPQTGEEREPGPLSAALPAAATVVIDDAVRLSASSLWQIQRRFFDSAGAEAWTTKGVPSYITSNAFIARAYARTVCAFHDDVMNAGVLQPDEPLRIVELGAGTGRFAYYVVRAAQAILERAGKQGPVLSYVLTDFTETNIELWRRHPRLAPLIESGWMDVARFDASDPGALELRASGEVIDGRAGRAPLVVVANYVLDSIPNDLFALEGGELFEELLTLSAPEGWESTADVEVLESLRLDWRREPIVGSAADVYRGDGELGDLLAFYGEHLSSTSFLVPSAAIECLRHFRAVAEPLLVLVADRGFHRLEDLLANPGPQMGLHGGAFSLPLNGHALAWHVERQGGIALHPPGGHSSLDVSAFLFGLDAGQSRHTRSAYVENAEEQGADDYFYLWQAFLRASESMTLSELLAMLRYSAYDPGLFQAAMPRLVTCVESAPDDVAPDLFRMLELVHANHFEIPGGYDLAFDIASILYGMGAYEEALSYLDRSEEEFGPHPSTSYNRGMCNYHLHRLRRALACMERTLELDPSFERARGMRVTIAGAMARLPVPPR